MEARLVILLADAVSLPEGMAATQRLLCLARGLQEAGTDVEVLLLRPTEVADASRNLQVKGETLGVPFIYTSGSSTLSPRWLGRRMHEALGLIRALGHIHRQWRTVGSGQVFVLLYSRHLSTVLPVAIWCRIRRIPIVLELCEWPETQPSPTWLGRWRKRLFCRYCVRFADGVVAISQFIEERVQEQARRIGRDLPILRVPILVDADESFREVPLSFVSRPFVLFSGSGAYRKTLAFVLAAFQIVSQRHLNLSLVFTGLSEMACRDLQHDAASLGLKGKVSTPGFIPRDALLTAYRKAEASLIPLFGDAQSQARFPTKLGEYLLAGRPVITTGTGEVISLLKDRQTAFIVQSGSVEACAEIICAALRDPNAGCIGEAGRRLAFTHLDYRQHGIRLNTWIKKLSHP